MLPILDQARTMVRTNTNIVIPLVMLSTGVMLLMILWTVATLNMQLLDQSKDNNETDQIVSNGKQKYVFIESFSSSGSMFSEISQDFGEPSVNSIEKISTSVFSSFIELSSYLSKSNKEN